MSEGSKIAIKAASLVLPRPLPAPVLDRVVQPILWSIRVSGDDVRRGTAGHDHLVRGKGVHVVVRRVEYFGTCKSQGNG